MSKVLITVRNITKKVMFKMCDLNIANEKSSNEDVKVIRRCLSDVANRSYCASSIKIENPAQKVNVN